MLRRELEAQRADRVDDDHLELVADLAHEARDLLHETIDGGLIAGLKHDQSVSAPLHEDLILTLSKVVIAYVATLRFPSEIRFSRSTLQVATLVGCVSANDARVRVAAKRREDFGDDRNN